MQTDNYPNSKNILNLEKKTDFHWNRIPGLWRLMRIKINWRKAQPDDSPKKEQKLQFAKKDLKHKLLPSTAVVLFLRQIRQMVD